MSNIYEHFHKDIITACPIISSIFGAGCDVQGNNIVINDFVNHTSRPTCELTIYQVLEIHKKNRDNSLNFYSTNSNDEDNLENRWSNVHNDVTYEELYGIYAIREDQIRQKRIFEQLSECLYTNLTAVLGTESIIRLRSKNADFGLLLSERRNGTAIGSRAEGFDLPWSDYDFLVDLGCISENNFNNSHKTWITYSSRPDVYPGYLIVEVKNGPCLSHNVIHDSYKRRVTMPQIHGPALQMSQNENEHDFVLSFKSINWPSIAYEWVDRNRRYGWPSTEMITDITKKGCHIVPVDSDRQHSNKEEWRLSFCVAEKKLIRKFNHTQLMIYGLLKIFLKELLSKRTTDDPELLCSYFIKTVMFWVIEETPRQMWLPENSIYCYHLCIRRLTNFVLEENCPNYFVPMNNMFFKRFKDNESKRIVEILQDTFSHGLLWTTKTNLLKNLYSGFHDFKTQRKRLIYTCQVNEKIEESLISKTVLPNLTSILFSNFKVFKRLSIKSPFLKQKLVPVLCHFVNVKKSIGHKSIYKFKQIIIKLLTLNKRDKQSYVLLASYLSDESMYEASLTVLELALMEICLERYGDFSYNKADIEEHFLYDHTMKTRRQYIDYFIFPRHSHLNSFLKKYSLLMTNFMTISDCLQIPWVMYILALKFYCYHKLKDMRQRDEALKSIENFVCEEHEQETFYRHGLLIKMFCCLVKKEMCNENVVNRIREVPERLLNIFSTDDFTEVDLTLLYDIVTYIT